MKNRIWRSRSRSLPIAAILAALAMANSLSTGCGSDDADVEKGGGPATVGSDAATPPPSGATLAMNFVASCVDSVDVGCAEFSGEKADAETIKAAAAKSCD